MEELKEKKICPLLMMAKAISQQTSGQCMGEACAWYHKGLQKVQGKYVQAGWCAVHDRSYIKR